MLLSTHTAPPFYKNGYLLGCESTHQAVIIDPGDEVDEVIKAVHGFGLHVTYILLTHAHLDHITGVARATQVFSAPVLLHEADLPLYDAVVQQGLMFGLRVDPQPPVDRFYAAGQVPDVRGVRGAAPSHARTLSGRGVPPGGTSRTSGARSLRRRHAVRRFDRANGPAGRRPPDAHSVDHVGSAGVPRRSAASTQGTASRRPSAGNAGRTRFFGIEVEPGRRVSPGRRSARPSPTRNPFSRCELHPCDLLVVDPCAVGALQVVRLRGHQPGCAQPAVHA